MSTANPWAPFHRPPLCHAEQIGLRGVRFLEPVSGIEVANRDFIEARAELHARLRGRLDELLAADEATLDLRSQAERDYLHSRSGIFRTSR